ncbi:eukaryotic aspartyl protease family protein [Striga asiatica]|uniref:Eukaryotic aspartyl protease family protein n=1 Tax=Striga asiatica TaxID=4170 RepID=A0A5A7PLR0_STRAF|nr:eukaryotic aspartyl protease family protein [Striga asiatica]
MVYKSLLAVGYFYLLSCCLSAVGRVIQNATENTSNFSAMAKVPTLNGASSSVSSDCGLSAPAHELGARKNEVFTVKKPPVVLNLKHSSAAGKKIQPLDSLTAKDSTRIQRLHSRIAQKSSISDKNPIIPPPEYSSGGPDGRLVATLESGVSLGSGEYLMDVFVGTPPKHFSLILDTGSDLNWIQCVPCHDCFDQTGPYYDPNHSSSYRNVSCGDPRCGLVSSPVGCRAQNQSCPYYYWYGDSSNTTGDFAVETFTVNLTGRAGLGRVENVMFGCGHWNRGLFHGAAGLLGLGRGPLSFASQLQSLYGHSFSYCLVDRNSNSSVSSKLIFGDLMDSKELNFTFTGLVGPNEGSGETFYYVEIKWIVVGGEVLEIPKETWGFSSEGGGGTIVDSGTTLTYFVEPAYRVIKEAFVKKVLGYPIVEDFPILGPCYNVSGSRNPVDDLPSLSIVFGDGAIWDFPVENYFIRLDPQDVLCLAILGTPRSGLSIIGNYQQQNFRLVYDTKRSRLGFAPAKCASM